MTAEHRRLQEAKSQGVLWQKWGPYLSERQWGTVREDYSPTGAAWEAVSHDDARSTAYRWGEEGIAGFSDDKQHLCLALGLWNGKDPILKERLFGLANHEGNHGEDVKEYYYYLDATPTHSYLKMLYKYPQCEFPYEQLILENRRRGKLDSEFELIDTGVFAADRYFDIFVEYAKVNPEDVLCRITVCNRGSEPASLHVLPQIWFRNERTSTASPPLLRLGERSAGTVAAHHSELGDYFFYADATPAWLFCENRTNGRRLHNVDGDTPFPKDGINDYVTRGRTDTVNPEQRGTKAAAHYRFDVPANGQKQVHLRLTKHVLDDPFRAATEMFETRITEADQFYSHLQQNMRDADARLVQRQAWAGMIWTKQYYEFDVSAWLKGDPGQPPPPPERRSGRNRDWPHISAGDVISVPDKWEFPWNAAWDLAFHCLPLAMIDPEFAKQQLLLLTREWYMHPNGQLPAYEWEFGDVNPPVHAWATWRVYKMDKKANGGRGDIAFLERIYHKLLLNFTWWVNRKDTDGHNIFQGGFLGLDNIGVFDRSSELPTGGRIEQCDGTSWMAMYCLNMMRIALELSQTNPTYQDTAAKFFEHFLRIAAALTNLGESGINLWDEEDQFFYDVLHTPDHHLTPLKVRSIVSFIPLFAVETLEPEHIHRTPEFQQRVEKLLALRPDMAALVSRWDSKGMGERRLLSLLRGHRLKRLLSRMLDETEFLSEFGVRALSKYHEKTPYVFHADGQSFIVRYQPGESDSAMFGGNSNWRGPVWMPINYLIIESLQKFFHYFGPEFMVECPVGSGNFMNILEISEELTRRLAHIFLRDEAGRRACFGDHDKLQYDPHFRDYLLFHEYFHGDSGRGLGASHQTGWTGLIAKLLRPRSVKKNPHHELVRPGHPETH